MLGVGDIADDLLAGALVAPQALGLALGVAADDGVGGGQDRLGGAVVLLQQDGAGVGIVALELEDVADRGAAERIDRLVGVTDDAQLAGAADELLHQHVLRVVGVLVFVDEDVAEPAAIGLGDLGVALQQVHHAHDQVVEVERVGLGEALLIERVGLGEGPLGGADRLGGEGLGVDQLVLQVGDLRGQPAGRIAFRVEVELADHELHEPAGVVGVIDRERRLETRVVVLGPQDAHARRVERRHPHQPGATADEVGDALLHLAGGLVGEGDRDDLTGVHGTGREQIGDPAGQHLGLARAGAGDDEQRGTLVGHGVTLRTVEPVEQRLRIAAAGRLSRGGSGHAGRL
ncbi:hypothetical protein GCM10027610_111160 [Dactylosporangium cerinum]